MNAKNYFNFQKEYLLYFLIIQYLFYYKFVYRSLNVFFKLRM